MPSAYELSALLRELGKQGEAGFSEVQRLVKMYPEAAAGVRGEGQRVIEAAHAPTGYGKIITPAYDQSAAEALQNRQAAEKMMSGDAGAGPNYKKAFAVAPAAAAGVTDPLEYIKEGVKAYQDNVTKPVSDAIKNTLTPDINVQGQTYKTASPVSDFAIDQASDPVNYVPGAAGAALQGAQMVGGYAGGGEVGKGILELAEQGPKAAQAILDLVNTPEIATALKGPERQAYLNALDAVHGTKAERAAKMGFDLSTPEYHGTSADIQEFKNPGNGYVFTSPDKDFANTFTTSDPGDLTAENAKQISNGQVYPLVTKAKDDVFSPFDVSHQKDFLDWYKNKYGAKRGWQGTAKLYLSEMKDPKIGWHTSELPVVKQFLKDKGYPAQTVFENNVENTATLDPKDIRSTQAAFDPRFADSAKILAAGAPVAGGVTDPFAFIRQGAKAYQENVSQPIASVIKKKLTPDIDVQGQNYQTSSPVSNFAIDQASDPVNYVPGAAGALLQGAQAVGGYAEGGAIPNFSDIPDESQQPKIPQAAPGGLPKFADLPDEDEKYGSLGQQAVAGLEGVAKGVISSPGLGVAERVLKRIGVPGTNASDIRGREAANPITSGVGEAAGLIGSSALGIGEGAALSKLGEAAAAASGLAKSTTTAAKIGSAAVRGATEMGLYQGQDELGKHILQDPQASSETALANIGLAAALGGAGAAFFTGAVSPLWKATVGAKTDNFLGALTSKLGGAEPIEGVAPKSAELAKQAGIDIPPEYAAKIDGAPGADLLHSTLSQTDTTKAGRNYQKGLEQLNADLGNGLAQAVGHDAAYAKDLGSVDKYTSGQQIGSDLIGDLKQRVEPIEKEYDAINEKLKDSKLSPEMIRDAADQISSKALEAGLHKVDKSKGMGLVESVLEYLPKQETAEDLKKYITNLSKGYDPETYDTLKEIKKILRETQKKAIMEGIAAKGGNSVESQAQVAAYEDLNKKYSQLLDTFDGLNEHLKVGRYEGPRGFLNNLKDMVDVRPEDVLNRLAGKTRADQLKALGEVSPEALAKVRQYHVDNLLRSAVDKDGNLNPYKFTKELGKLSPQLQDVIASPEAKQKISAINEISDSLLDKTHNFSNTGRTIDKLTHGAISPITFALSMFGHGYGALLGHLGTLGYKEGKDALKLSMLKFLGSNQPVKSEAFKAMASMVHNSIKGEQMLTKGAEAVFSKSTVVPFSGPIKAADIEKLDKLVAQNNQNPDNLMSTTQGDLGHYMPDHQAALAQTMAAQVSYLASLKPHGKVLSPFAKEMKPTGQEQQRYEEALKTAINPYNTYAKVKDGSLKITDMQDMQAMYPAVLSKMTNQLMKSAMNAHAMGQVIPFKVKTSMSLMSGQALDPALTPVGIMSAQPMPKPQAPSPQPAGKQKKGTSTLGKSNKDYMTPDQTAEADRANRH